MAWCRWSFESDLYIYEHVDGTYRCVDCRFGTGADFAVSTRPEMERHIEKHRAAGDRVPEWL